MTQSLLTRPLVHEEPRPSLDKYLPKQLDRPTERELDQVLAERQSFSKEAPGRQLVLDSTSVKAMFHCPRRYYYELILGLRTPQQSRDLIFGLAYQEALVEYELCRAGGGSHEHSIQSALQVGLIRGKDLPVDPKADGEGTTPIKKRKDMLALAIVTYCDQFGINDPIQTLRLTNGKPAVELSFRFGAGIGFPDGEEVEFSGHLDRAASSGSGAPVYIVDNKSTGKQINSDYVLQYTPDPQISHYTIGGKVAFHFEVTGVLIDACQVLANAVDLKRFPVSRTPDQISEYYQNVEALVHTYDGYRKARYWPMNESACHICPFRRGLCSHQPGVRRLHASLDFIKHAWDPAVPR
jgi:hypothetical protein